MDSFFKILLAVLQFIRLVAVGFALYGLIWLPRFQNGLANGPHWLLYLYDSGVPILLGIGAIGFVFVFLYNLIVALIPGQSPSPLSVVFRGLFLWILIVAFIGGLPSFVSAFSHMQQVGFESDTYHLIQRETNSDTVEYFVYRCADPIGLWCERVAVTNDLPAPPPTPTPVYIEPAPIEEVQDPELDVDVTYAEEEIVLPTVTPPAALTANDAGELLFEVGEFQAVLTYTEPITSILPSLDGE